MVLTIGEEFDGISEVYDQTRHAATEAELNALSRELKDCRLILDVGVGTGRFAKPLSDEGFEVIGIDLSRKMISKAKLKGVGDVILADARYLPFENDTFDGSIIVHVFHLLPDWQSVVHEMSRVTKTMVATFLSNHGGGWWRSAQASGDTAAGMYPKVWERYAELRAQMGYPIQRNKRMWQNEAEIKSKFPPSKLVEVSNEIIHMRIGDLIEHRPPFMQSDIPADVHKKILEQLLPEIAEKEITRRETEELAVWRPSQLRST